MIKALQRSSETGRIPTEILEFAKKGKELTVSDVYESITIMEGQEKASAEVDRIYKEKSEGGYSEIIERFRGRDSQGRKVGKDFIKQWTEKHEGRPDYKKFEQDIYSDMMYNPVYGVFGAITSYKPGTIGKEGKEITLAQHIFGRLNVKNIDVANKFLGKG